MQAISEHRSFSDKTGEIVAHPWHVAINREFLDAEAVVWCEQAQLQ